METYLSLFGTYPTLPLGGALALLLAYTIYLHFKLRTLTKGGTGQSLEQLISQALSRAQEISKENEELRNHALVLDKRLSHAIRNTQTLRYKAFETGGSNQSFSIAFLNEQGNGVVLSSLHARERISTFAKPIEKFGSTYELTEEERQVIEDAMRANKKG